MTKQTFALFLLLLIMAFCPILVRAQTTACCDDASCQARAKELVADIGKATDFLGAYPTTQPVDFKGKKRFLDSLKLHKPSNYNAITKAAKQINDWTTKDVTRRVCLAREYANLSEDQLNWVNYFVTSLYVSTFRSPEFRKGFAMHIHANIGVKSLFTTSERFASVSGLLFSYTFTPKGQTTGGKWRAMLGPGIYYSETKAYVLVHPRLEFRLKDIGNELTSIGCFKLIAQGGFQKDIQMAGLGLGAEISRLTIQLTGDYIFNQSALLIQTGFMLSFPFNKR